jgi:hypothetical protein
MKEKTIFSTYSKFNGQYLASFLKILDFYHQIHLSSQCHLFHDGLCCSHTSPQQLSWFHRSTSVNTTNLSFTLNVRINNWAVTLKVNTVIQY